MDIARRNLQHFHQEGDKFFKRMVANDKTWTFSFDPELKRESCEWWSSSLRSQKVARAHSALKVMHMTFFDFEGIVSTLLFRQVLQ